MVSEKISIRVRNDATKSKYTRVDLTFLSAWLGEQALALVDELQLFVRNQTSSTAIYNVRKVLNCWASFALANNLPNFLGLDAKLLEVQVSALRYRFFKVETESGRSLNTTYCRWNAFLKYLSFISERKLIPPIRTESPALVPPPFSEVCINREEAVLAMDLIGPRNLNRSADSYNEDLFENLSIVQSDQQYLSEYTSRLGRTIETIKDCALKDIQLLKEKRAECQRLVESLSPEQIKKIKNPNIRNRFTDASSGLHILKLPDDHPFLLSNLLYIAVMEMGGIPRQHRSYTADGRVNALSEFPHWNYITLYGKNKLLPYLGLMNSYALAPCLVVLLLELPRVNATSLLRARISNEDGREILLSASGEGNDDEELTITVDKPRARQEKSMKLSDLARSTMRFVLEWTKPIREEMIKRGQVDEAKWLWVGIKQNNYNLINYTQKTAFNSLRLDDKHHSRGTKYNTTRGKCFIERHPCLTPWASKINFKALRLNAGVLEYLKSDGDLVVAARAFGHKNIATTIKTYIPKPLRLAIYERQIRRHQNSLILSSVLEENGRLQCSDFNSREDLHLFLESQPKLELAEDATNDETSRKFGAAQPNKKIIIYENADTLAIAMLYRRHLQGAPAGYVEKPDLVTGIAPKFWIDFVGALMVPLPLAMADICDLVNAAKARIPHIEKQIRFPSFEV